MARNTICKNPLEVAIGRNTWPDNTLDCKMWQQFALPVRASLGSRDILFAIIIFSKLDFPKTRLKQRATGLTLWLGGSQAKNWTL